MITHLITNFKYWQVKDFTTELAVLVFFFLFFSNHSSGSESWFPENHTGCLKFEQEEDGKRGQGVTNKTTKKRHLDFINTVTCQSVVVRIIRTISSDFSKLRLVPAQPDWVSLIIFSCCYLLLWPEKFNRYSIRTMSGLFKNTTRGHLIHLKYEDNIEYEDNFK